MEHHTFGYWMWFLLIGGVIGWLAGVLTRGRGFGIIGDIVIGVVGSMLGSWLAMILGLSGSSSLGVFMMALLGAVILVGLTRFEAREA